MNIVLQIMDDRPGATNATMRAVSRELAASEDTAPRLLATLLHISHKGPAVGIEVRIPHR